MENLSGLDITPNVNFLTTLRNSGYNNYAAIADIIDNSLDTNVNTKNVKITIKKNKDEYDFIKIADDGQGMDMETLKEAFKLGAITGKDRELDLGSYGTGLKAAALSIGKAFEVATKTSNGQFYIATYDLETLLEQNTFKIPIRIGSLEEYTKFTEDTTSENGTVIKIYKLDKVSNTNASIFKDILKTKIGQFYKFFIDEFNINIYVNNELVKSFDPMYRREPYTTCMSLNEKINYKGIEIKFSVYNIEFVNETISGEISRNNANAGLYIYRNNRLVGSGLDLGIISKHGDGYLNGFRVEMFVNGVCDDLFGSTFNKMIHEKDKNDMDQGFRDVCHNIIKGYSNTLKRKARENRANASITKEDRESMDQSIKSINQNSFIDVKRERGANTRNETPSEKKETIKVGSKPNQTRTRDDKFVDYRFIKLGENGVMFRSVKEHGLYIIEINQEHPFWVNFLSNSSLETKDVILKLLVSLGVSLEDTEYYNDSQKETLLNEYFIKVSDRLRKLIIY